MPDILVATDRLPPALDPHRRSHFSPEAVLSDGSDFSRERWPDQKGLIERQVHRQGLRMMETVF